MRLGCFQKMLALGARRLRATPMNAGNEMALPFLPQETHITANWPEKTASNPACKTIAPPFFPARKRRRKARRYAALRQGA